MAALDLPTGYALEEVLSERRGVRVARARRGALDVVLRLDPGWTGESLSELRALAAVDHPGIAALVDQGVTPGGTWFVARRFVEGVDLRAFAARATPEDVGRAVADLCDALAHLHARGVVHGDLKPENAIRTPDGRTVLVDLGLARIDGEPASGVQGSWFALAPELLFGEAATPRSDLFALGVLLFDLLRGLRASPRDFYARFPAQSFFSALGSSPEELPGFARDLVAELVARAPERRPHGAEAVAQALRARLSGGARPAQPATLAFPALAGREAFAARLFQDLEGDPRPVWIAVPDGDDAAAVASALRVHAALRGAPCRAAAPEHELGRDADAGRADAWAAALAALAPAWIVAHHEGDPRAQAALDALARAAAAEERAELARADGDAVDRGPAAGGPGDRPRSRRVVVVASRPPESAGDARVAWRALALPEVGADALERFLAARMPGEDRARVRAFAERVAGAAGGAAARVARALGAAGDRGLLLDDADGLRLRPGPLPESLAELARDPARGLSPAAARALAALAVCGGRAGAVALARVLDADEAALGPALLELSARGAARLAADGLVARAPAPPLPPAELERMHARRAEALAAEGAPARCVLPHRFRAAPGEGPARALASEAAALCDDGRAELALWMLEGLSAEGAAGALLDLARAEAWVALGRRERASALIAPLLEAADPTLRARALVLRGEIASRRESADEARAAFAQAAELDPAAAGDARVGRARLAYALGDDAEVARLAAEGDAAGATPRQRSFLRSLAALADFRSGRVAEARAATLALVAAARAAERPARVAALLINLATIERRAGDAAAAERALREAVVLATEGGRVDVAAHARGALAGVLRERGELAEAAPLCEASLAARERLGDEGDALVARGMLGLLLAERGHVRPAIQALEGAASRMQGAQAISFAPLLRARADEMRARAGLPPGGADPGDDAADPRVFASRARAAWLHGLPERALTEARRALELARRLGLEPVVDEAALLCERLGAPADGLPRGRNPLVAEDRRVGALLAEVGDAFQAGAAEAFAEELAARGRDDRAARLLLAVHARSGDPVRARAAWERAQGLIAACAAGLGAREADACAATLLGRPDPFPGDLAPRPGVTGEDDQDETDMLALLEINKLLLRQESLPGLLATIVECALGVTGGERGFLVLEEKGELLFDAALDSRKGEIHAPDLEVSRTVIREALDRMEPILVSSAVDDPLLAHNPSVVSLELRSILCTPFEVEDGLRGAIYLDHRLRTGAFSERALKLSSLLADQAALAILQMRRLEEIRALNAELEGRIQRTEEALRAARVPDEGAETLLGRAPSMVAARRLLELAAAADIPVLIQGESGTGKELAARTLHALSARAGRPLVAESCAALPPSLIESELFGHKKGAFTGAERDREGLFERADGGTLFLDEVGELPLELQAKLLRVLETGEVRRVGDAETRKVDVRLVTATHRDLEREAEADTFRRDLYYRLNGLKVELPPLSERPQDVPELARHFLRRVDPTGRRRISEPVLRALVSRPWPGNARELRNEIERLALLSPGDLDDPALVSRPPFAFERKDMRAPATLAEIEKEAILQALEHAGGDKRRAAEMLGISRAKIYQRLKEWEEQKGPS